MRESDRCGLPTGQAAAFARAVVYAMSQPEDLDIDEILFRATRQEF